MLDDRDFAPEHRLDATVDVRVVACAEHLVDGRDVENGADRTQKLQWFVVAILEHDGAALAETAWLQRLCPASHPKDLLNNN